MFMVTLARSWSVLKLCPDRSPWANWSAEVSREVRLGDVFIARKLLSLDPDLILSLSNGSRCPWFEIGAKHFL